MTERPARHLAVGSFIVIVAIVVGIGHAVASGGSPNVGLSIVATAVVAVGFQPVRERVQRFANRLVYGKRATPYEVLSELSAGMAHAVATEELLPHMARVVAEGTGAARVDVWLQVGAAMVLEATSAGSNGQPGGMVPVVHGGQVSIEGGDVAVPVRHQGELLGLIGVKKSPGETMTPGETKLLEDLASQAGLLLRNVRLLEELRASRRRLVGAQNAERRKIERNLHDGAQQQLVALKVQLGLLGRFAADSDRVERMAQQLQDALQGALDDLRDLARGIYPPLLADQGLVVALEAQARKGAAGTAVESDGIGRYAEEVETAVYFCALEAMQNVSKYAEATATVVRLAEIDGYLSFEIDDNGRGFKPDETGYGTGLQGMADRLDAIGGKVEVASEPGRGTQVRGRIRLP